MMEEEREFGKCYAACFEDRGSDTQAKGFR